MSKVLVTDFFGTLIPGNAFITDKLYGNHRSVYNQNYQLDFSDKEKLDYAINKMNLHTSIFLKPFLEEGNRLVIVTSADSHDPADWVYQNLVSEIIKYSSEYSSQISLFFQSESTAQDVLRNLKEVVSIYEKDGVMYATDSNGFTFSLIRLKEQVFDFLTISGDELYAIGDDFPDFSMLSKCMQLGGKSSIINEFMLRPLPIEEIIIESASRDKYLKREEFIFERYPEINDTHNYSLVIRAFLYDNVFDSFKNELRAYYWQKREEYYQQLANCSFNIFDELRKNELNYKIRLYNSIVAKQQKDIRIKPEEWFEKVDMYPSFQNYYQRVLAKH